MVSAGIVRACPLPARKGIIRASKRSHVVVRSPSRSGRPGAGGGASMHGCRGSLCVCQTGCAGRSVRRASFPTFGFRRCAGGCARLRGACAVLLCRPARALSQPHGRAAAPRRNPRPTAAAHRCAASGPFRARYAGSSAAQVPRLKAAVQRRRRPLQVRPESVRRLIASCSRSVRPD